MISAPRGHPGRAEASIGEMSEARYDGLADWYDELRAALGAEDVSSARRLLGRGPGRCLDVGCGARARTRALAGARLDAGRRGRLGRPARGSARARGLRGRPGARRRLPFADASFDAGGLDPDAHRRGGLRGGVARSRACCAGGARFVYVGVHPSFVGPHSGSSARKASRAPRGLPPVAPLRLLGARRANADGVGPASAASHLRSHDFFAAFTRRRLRGSSTSRSSASASYPHIARAAAGTGRRSPQTSSSQGEELAHLGTEPAREAAPAPLPDELHPRVREALAAPGHRRALRAPGRGLGRGRARRAT